MDSNERERLDKIVRDSPNLLASIVESAMDAIIAVDDAQHIMFFNGAAERMFACPANEAMRGSVERFIPERFRAGHSMRVRRFGESGVTNRTLHGLGTLWGLRATGEEFPIEASISKVESGGQRYFTVVIRDITERKMAEEALAGMTRKLVESQEQERARIGRELHDDINQRLAMLSLELEQLQHNPSEVKRRVLELRKQMREISNDVQAISHDLHSPKLEYLGVVAGMKSWCKEFAERQRMVVNFKSDVPSVLPFEIGLSLFRVLQEALHNVIKHSGIRRVDVELREDSNQVHLIISDSGKGFDVPAALRGKGLGLTSMLERVRLVSGTITIESKPMGGTIIHVRMPLESEHAAQREAV